MSGDWLVVERRRKGKHRPYAVELQTPCASSSTSAGPAVNLYTTALGLHVDHEYLDLCTAVVQSALEPLLQRINKAHATLLSSEFLRCFERALHLVEAEELCEDTSKNTNKVFSFTHAHHMIVYGLGSPSNGKNCMLCSPEICNTVSTAVKANIGTLSDFTGGKVTWSQLAFACWLRTKLSIQTSMALDPVFTPLDKELLRVLCFEVTAQVR